MSLISLAIYQRALCNFYIEMAVKGKEMIDAFGARNKINMWSVCYSKLVKWQILFNAITPIHIIAYYKS